MDGLATAVTWERLGAVASTVNEFTERALLALPALSVTVTVQLLWVPSDRVLKVTVLLLAEADVPELLQLPP